ncbi:P-type conjugative transfer protein TrbG [Helicobacter monodelphidis]|uniref:P-type conjugative transfer protein TrbG n=1 Tax=Helicobacter sp. 15-1451 TaxID=2004995 RepID=UPI00215CEC8D|nr:P-type conjugative transfer protein TrbG [Helicobacter sp. 15-1451]
MRKLLAMAFVCSVLNAVPPSQEKINFLSEDDIELTNEELKNLELAQQFMNSDGVSVLGNNGVVRFLYGQNLPSVISAPLQITDIVLQEGESIQDVQIGDSVRWTLAISQSGTSENATAHIIIKPSDAGLQTNLAILTDRRTYYLKLISKAEDYMTAVGFEYSDNLQATLNAYKKARIKKAESKQFEVEQGITSNIDNLSFDYRIEGNADFRPIRVYTDGKKTYIQMPEDMTFYEAPILMILDKSNDPQMVNYRLKHDRFIVDKPFQKAILYKNAGWWKQEKITITRINNEQYRQEVTDKVLYELTGKGQ